VDEVFSQGLQSFLEAHPTLCRWWFLLLVPIAHLYWKLAIHSSIIRLRKWDMLGTWQWPWKNRRAYVVRPPDPPKEP